MNFDSQNYTLAPAPFPPIPSPIASKNKFVSNQFVLINLPDHFGSWGQYLVT